MSAVCLSLQMPLQFISLSHLLTVTQPSISRERASACARPHRLLRSCPGKKLAHRLYLRKTTLMHYALFKNYRCIRRMEKSYAYTYIQIRLSGDFQLESTNLSRTSRRSHIWSFYCFISLHDCVPLTTNFCKKKKVEPQVLNTSLKKI